MNVKKKDNSKKQATTLVTKADSECAAVPGQRFPNAGAAVPRWESVAARCGTSRCACFDAESSQSSLGAPTVLGVRDGARAETRHNPLSPRDADDG